MDFDQQKETEAQRKTRERMEAGQEQSDALDQEGYYAGSGDEESGSGLAGQTASKGAGKAVTKLATSTNPVGKVGGMLLGIFNFAKNNKKATITGGGILGTIISFAILIITLTSGTQVMWLAAMLGDFNFGPHQRNSIARSERIVHMIRNNSFQGSDTRMARQAQSISDSNTRMNRVDNTPRRNYGRGNQRFKFRPVIMDKINTARRSGIPRFQWRFFDGRSSDSDRFRSPRNRVYGTDEGRRRTRSLSPQLQEDVDAIHDADDSQRESRNRSRVRGGSVIAGLAAIGCISAAIEDEVPDPRERYEILMGRAGKMQAAGSQLATGEDVHGDEVGDLKRAFQDTETIPAPDDDVDYEAEKDDLSTRDPPEEVDLEDGDAIVEEDSLAGSAFTDDLGGETQVHRSFSHSAAWARASQREVQGDEPDIDLSFPAEDHMVAQTILTIGRAVNSVPLTSGFCAVMTNPIVEWTLFGVEAIVSAVTGAGAIGRFAVAELIFYGIAHLLLNLSFDALVPSGPAELFGHIDMGSNMANSENSRWQGGLMSRDEDMNQQRDDHMWRTAQEDRERGFVWRYLSPENHRSVLARVAMGGGGLPQASDFLQPFTDFSTTISSAFSRAFTPARADERSLLDFENYDIYQYKFNEEQIGEGDIIAIDRVMDETEGYECEARGVMHPDLDHDIDEIIIPADQFEDGKAKTARSITYTDEGVYYDFWEVDNPDQRCDLSRWFDAELMNITGRDCMEKPYYTMLEDDRSHPLNDFHDLSEWEWSEYGDGFGGDISDLVDDEGEPIAREVGPGEGWNPIIHTIDCRYPLGTTSSDFPETPKEFSSPGYRPPYVRSQYSDQRDFWWHYGQWRLDRDLMDVIDCLSHDQPCPELGVGGEGTRQNGGSGTGELQTPDDLSQEGCPDPYYRMPESDEGVYTFRSIPKRRCGHLELIQVLYTVAHEYHDEYGPGSRLDIGDLNAAGHASHRWGIAADINAKGDVAAARSSDPNYSTEATIDLGKILVDTGLIGNIWWCEPGDGSTEAIDNYAEQQGTPIDIRCIEGHNNHFHIDLDENQVPRGPEHTP